MTPMIGIMASAAMGSKRSSYESIATLSGTGASATISFTSIPNTFKHLQIRVLGRSSNAATNDLFTVFANGDTTAGNYAYHRLNGDGATVTTTGAASSSPRIGYVTGATATADVMGVTILDIIDYASTTKNKTFKSFSGQDRNGAGIVWLASGLWMSTSAINQIDLTLVGLNWTTQTTIALYGIKG